VTEPDSDLEPPVIQAEPSPEADAFYAGAYRRIVRTMLVIPVLITPLLWLRYGKQIAMGFIAGSVIAYYNFYALKRGVAALADKVTRTGQKQSVSGVVSGFLFRYFLIAAAAYVILKGSAASIYGLFGGLFLPVAAILIEAIYETYAALRRGL
jgi:hypothetical protein